MSGKAIEIWFADEARIGQKNKITRRWALGLLEPDEAEKVVAAYAAYQERMGYVAKKHAPDHSARSGPRAIPVNLDEAGNRKLLAGDLKGISGAAVSHPKILRKYSGRKSS